MVGLLRFCGAGSLGRIGLTIGSLGTGDWSNG